MQSPLFDLTDVKVVYDSDGNRREVILSYQQFQRIAEFLKLHADVDENEIQSIVGNEQAVMAREEAAYRKLHPALLKKYPGQYVAIHGGELVDHDADQAALYLRVKSRHPEEFVWIAPVRPEPEEIYINRPPRFIGAG